MHTAKIVEILKSTPNVNAEYLAATLNVKKAQMRCTLNYLYRRKIVARELMPYETRKAGRKNVYVYRLDECKNSE
jgi:predicted transcriptional regulator